MKIIKILKEDLEMQVFIALSFAILILTVGDWLYDRGVL